MAMVPLDVNPGVFRYQEEEFLGAGVDSFSSPTEQLIQGGWTQLDNIMPVADGAINRRRGYITWSAIALDTIRKMYEYQKDSTGLRAILCSGAKLYGLNEDGTVYHSGAILTASGGAGRIRVANSRDIAYISDGVAADLIKWDGSAVGGTSSWGFTAPATAISVGVPGAGAITLLTGRNYFVAFKNSSTGHVGDISPISASTGPLTANNVPLSSIAVSANAQVDKKVILATGDGGDASTLYLVTELANAVTTYTDNTPEGTLLLQNLYLETDSFGNEIGISENTPPPSTGILPTKHAGRLFLAVGQILWFSKSLSEVTTSTGTITSRYEEAWPGDNQLDISVGAETVRGLLSDGQSIYIGTERHIRRIEGDSPSNFSTSEVVFNETGIMNQDVWQVVFSEGSPKGAMWLTPNNRVLLSDYNTYVDVGTPIQDQLNSINVANAPSSAWAAYVSDGQYDLYLLAVPTGNSIDPNKIFVFDLRHKKWVTWTPFNFLTCGLYNITSGGVSQWLFGSTATSLFSMTSSATTDNSHTITSTIQSQWLDFGDGTTRKILNEMDIQTSDSGLLVTVEGASTRTEFNTPLAVTTGATVVAGLFGDYKIRLAGKTTKSRYYRFKFVSTASTSPVLDSWSVEGVGVNRL